MSEVKPKILSCVFWENVLCSFRKFEKFGIMGRCFKCEQYLRFNREMEKQDQEDDDYFREVSKHPERHLSGEI